MLKHIYDQSFVAHVASTTAGYEGYLDCAKLAVRGGLAARIDDDWLVATSLVAHEPHRFWFRCMQDEGSGDRHYDIQSWSRRSGRNFTSKSRHLEFNYNGYAGLYDQPTTKDRLWRVITQVNGQYASVGDDLQVGQSIAARILTHSLLPLCATGRESVEDHWFAYAATSGGPVLELNLEVTDIGEELMDDH